ncbi:MAG: SPASM domain-containing protein [Alphaproteobacteria bacterium]|jgi:radical SAM protein with 4Fe4S-binding SPASM domain|nr:SPASM domain-containing protein [Alphaproteobacteria bacterium]
MLEDRESFMTHRRAQEKSHLSHFDSIRDALTSLLAVEMNITELCNRVCSFCPRVDPEVYPNRNLSMELGISRKVALDLKEVGYCGRITFSGFGESLLNKKFTDHIRIFYDALPESFIETNTNGDKLTVEILRELYDAGITGLYVNLYDSPDQAQHFEEMFAAAGIDEDKYKLRPHWPGGTEDFGMTLNNRGGTMKNDKLGLAPLDHSLTGKCYYPFYKMFVDWNGDVLFCSNDWRRKIVVGNVLESAVGDIWMSEKMHDIRLRLSNGDRNFSPCNQCDVQGALHGESSFDLLMSYYAGAENDDADPVLDKAAG